MATMYWTCLSLSSALNLRHDHHNKRFALKSSLMHIWWSWAAASSSPPPPRSVVRWRIKYMVVSWSSSPFDNNIIKDTSNSTIQDLFGYVWTGEDTKKLLPFFPPFPSKICECNFFYQINYIAACVIHGLNIFIPSHSFSSQTWVLAISLLLLLLQVITHSHWFNQSQ